MIASLKPWFPSVTFSTSNLRAGTAHNKKFDWSAQMDQEFRDVKFIFESQIRLSPYDKTKKLNLLTDGASRKGVGFVVFQYINDARPDLGCTNVAANSSALKDTQLAYSPVDCELLALKFAASATHYYLYGCPIIYVFTDCSSLE